MNLTDKKYLIGTLFLIFFVIGIEFVAYAFTDNILISSIILDERKIVAELKFHSSNDKQDNSKFMTISLTDEKNEYVEEATFFLTIANKDEDVFRKYFFIDKEELLIRLVSNSNEKIKISGEQQYTFDAYIMSSDSELRLEGPFLISDEEYTIKIKLKTIDSIGNIVSKAEEFEFQINSDNLDYQSKDDFKINKQNKATSVNFLEFEANQMAHLNNFGFRGPDIDPQNIQGKSRIVLMGGSTMYGAGATSDQSTIAGYLQEIVDKKIPKKKLEIINAGIQGIDSDTELKMMKADIIKLLPEFIIIFDGWNDLQNNKSSEEIYNNWNEMCRIGIENDIQVIIILQPIAGFGNKDLTEKEYYYSKNGVDKNDIKLNTKIFQYDEYQDKLKQLLDECTSMSFRNVFNDITKEVYWDEGHLNDYGNSIIAEEFFETFVKDFNISKVSEPFSEIKEKIKIPITMDEILSNYKTPNFLKQKIFNLFI